MKILVAIDSFKGCMTSLEAGEAAKEGILRACPDADVTVRPMADGGEGTVDALSWGREAEDITITVTGPFGAPTQASYRILDKTTAVMEMSAASGITLVPRQELNPMKATSYGTGEMIRDAVRRGCTEIILGIGGSATNDAGCGMLEALGWTFLDASGSPIPRCGAGLKDIASIDDSKVLPELKNVTFRSCTDVTNPLTGETGASAIFGPQKGADEEMVRTLDSYLAHFAEVSGAYLKTQGHEANPDYPGSGAAGGMGFALREYLGAALEPGVDLVLDFTKLEDAMKTADCAVTGEGRIDRQTVMGKAPSGIARLAGKYGIPVIAFSGSVTDDAVYCNDHGIDAFFPILRTVCSLDEAMDNANAKRNMADASEQVFRAMKAAEKFKNR